MELIDTLKKLDFTDKQAAVYLAGLELGPASVQALAIKTKVKRTTVYQVLEELKEKELFKETIKGKKRLFVAAHPNQLKVLQNDREQALEQSFDELLQITNVTPGKPKVLYFDTLEGIHKMYESALENVEEETIGIGDGETAKRLGEEWLQKYIKKREKTGATSRMILTDSEESREWSKNDQKDNRETRILPKERQLPVNFEVIGNTIIITSLVNETLGLSIESEKVATSMREILDIVWESTEN